MEELNYILRQAKRFHFTKWNDEELKKCVDMLTSLTRSELVALYTNRWILGSKTLKEEIFKLLFSDKIGKQRERIESMETDKLIEELLDKKGGLVSLSRQELKRRYQENEADDRTKIAIAFAKSSIRDHKWIEAQLKKELYGDNKKKAAMLDHQAKNMDTKKN